MFDKVLVANRGEIAIRAFRAAFELGANTVAVFPYEDRNSTHRLKADESYQIGVQGHPVRAYLSVEEVIAAAQRSGADAIYPGYGFLSENPDLAAACAAAGISFVGPPTSVLELTGNKARAVAAAHEAGLPVLASSRPSADVDELGAVGAARDSLETAIVYAQERRVFDKALAGYQITQERLADMTVELGKAMLLALHLGQLKDAGELSSDQVSLGKLNNVREALDIARTCRALLGASGITTEYPVLRHALNLESVLTYEGTSEVHQLVIGRALTGQDAFR